MRLFDQDNNVSLNNFEQAVEHNATTFNDLTVVGISAKAFELGEKLAKFRNSFVLPDTESIAELKALYQTLLERFHQTYFAGHARMEYESLQRSVTDTDSVGAKKRISNQTPPDVRIMIDIYNAIWNIHYQEFLKDPITTMANWDLEDAYQTRAIRAVLHDIPYKEAVTVACMMVFSQEDTPEDNPNYEIIAAKQQLVSGIIFNREETPAVVAHRLRRGDLKERGLVLKTVLSGLQSDENRVVQGVPLEDSRNNGRNNSVVPFAKKS